MHLPLARALRNPSPCALADEVAFVLGHLGQHAEYEAAHGIATGAHVESLGGDDEPHPAASSARTFASTSITGEV